jgi:hypothetical protein
MSPLDWICPPLAIDADAFNHGGTPEFAALSAVALRHKDISNILSTATTSVRAGPWPQAEWRRRRAAVVPGIPCRHAIATIGLGPAARRQQHKRRLAPAHPAALRGRSRAATARTTKEDRSPDRRILAQRPCRNSRRRRGHTPVLDADPVRHRQINHLKIGLV